MDTPLDGVRRTRRVLQEGSHGYTPGGCGPYQEGSQEGYMDTPLDGVRRRGTPMPGGYMDTPLEAVGRNMGTHSTCQDAWYASWEW